MLRFGNRDPNGGDLVVSLSILALIAIAPAYVTNDYWRGVLVVSMYFAMLAAAWNLLAGYTGQFSLAPAAFGMIGAYVTGMLAYYYGIPPLIGIAAAIIVAAAIGFLLGRIVLRLRGPYLALTTLSFAEIIRLVISNSIDITRGDLGLNVPGILDQRIAYYYLMLGVLLAVQRQLFGERQASSGQTQRELVVGEDSFDGVAEGAGIAVRDDERVVVVAQHFLHAADAGGDDGNAASGSFQHRIRKAFEG